MRPPRAVRWLVPVVVAVAMSATMLTIVAQDANSAPAPRFTATRVIPECTTSDLEVWVAADQAEGAAGTWYFPLEFTNIGQRSCVLYAFPGVSAIDADGRQLGAPAVWDHAVAPTNVLLAPAATGYASLAYSAVVTGNCPASGKAVAARLRVYPPDQYDTVNAMWSLPACTTPGQDTFLRVRVIAPGIGIRGSAG